MSNFVPREQYENDNELKNAKDEDSPKRQIAKPLITSGDIAINLSAKNISIQND